jgi:hypothetical protein
MIQFLEDLKGKGTPPITAEEREELEKLRRDHKKLRVKLELKNKANKDGGHTDDSDDSSEVTSSMS